MHTLIKGPVVRKKLGNISRDTLFRWRQNHGLPFIKLPGSKTVLYSQEEIDKWIQNNTFVKGN